MSQQLEGVEEMQFWEVCNLSFLNKVKWFDKFTGYSTHLLDELNVSIYEWVKVRTGSKSSTNVQR